MFRRAPVAVAFAVLVAACNALTGVGDLGIAGDDVRPTVDGGPETSTGGGGGDGDASGERDGSNDDAAAAVEDAGSDGDGGADANADGDAAPLGFCASLSPAPTQCSDFDDGTLAPWTATPVGGGIVAVDTTVSRSAPRSLRIAMPASSSGRAYASRTFAGAAPTTITVAFSIRVDAVATDTTQELAVVKLGAKGGNAYEVQLELTPQGVLSVEEETPLDDGTVPERDVPTALVIPSGQWRRVTWTITVGATSSSMTVAVEGTPAPATISLSAHSYKAAPHVDLGHNGLVTTPYSLYYDDVVVDLK